MRILANDALCLIIDVQEKLLPVIDKKEEFIENTSKLIDGLQALAVPIIVSEQYKKGLGETVEQLKERLKNSAIDKITFSAWENDEIRQQIIESGRKHIILSGIESHVCVLQTAIDLLAKGYQVSLVSDCIGSRMEKDRLGAIARCSHEGGIITTYEALLFELCRQAGTDEFKKLIKIVK